MKKGWFDNWEVKYQSKGDGFISKVSVTVPHAYGTKVVRFRSVRDARIKWLISVLECALSELTKKK